MSDDFYARPDAEFGVFEEDYEYYRVSGCVCPEPFLCQGRCQSGNTEGEASRSRGSDTL
jgi:hypothetical protein